MENLKILPSPPKDKIGWPWTSETDPSIYDPSIAWPKISIVTPSYNQGQFIEETIRTVLFQNYPNLEYIIIDGGSTDNTTLIIKKYEKWITHWVSEPDQGQSDAINKGFDKATGQIFAWINSDDRYLPNAFFTIADFYLKNPDIHVIIGEADKVDISGNLIYHSKPPELTLESFLHWRDPERPSNTGNFLQPACFFSKKAWDTCGPLRLDLDYCMDVALWLEMVKKFQFRKIDANLAVALGHPDAKTTAEKEKTTVEINLLITKYGGEEIAKKELMRMANNYSILKHKWNSLMMFFPIRIAKRFIKRAKALLA